MTTEEKTNGVESRQVKAAAKAKERAQVALVVAFRAYQQWQVADCVARNVPIDAGDKGSFADWAGDQ